MQEKTLSAIAFALVLIFVVIAGLVVYANVRGQLGEPMPALPAEEVPIPSPTSPAPSPTAGLITAEPIAPPAEEALSTPTPPAATPTPARTLAPTIQVVTPTPIVMPAISQTPTPTGTRPTPTRSVWPTPTRPGSYTFYLDGDVVHDTSAGCMAQYIRGIVQDQAGNPLEGVRIKAYDIWGNEVFSVSKGGVDVGKWDIVLGPTDNIWHVVVVDAAGQELSPVAVVPHHQEGPFEDACVHIVNWRRAW